MRGVGVSFSTKTARVDYVPEEVSIERLIEVVGRTHKYRASLAAPVEARLERGGATWTLRAEQANYAPGEHGRVVLSRSLGVHEGVRALWRGEAGLSIAADEPARGGDGAVAAAGFLVPAGSGEREFRIEVEVREGADPPLSLSVVVPIRQGGTRCGGGQSMSVSVDSPRVGSADLGARVMLGLLALAPLLLAARPSAPREVA